MADIYNILNINVEAIYRRFKRLYSFTGIIVRLIVYNCLEWLILNIVAFL